MTTQEKLEEMEARYMNDLEELKKINEKEIEAAKKRIEEVEKKIKDIDENKLLENAKKRVSNNEERVAVIKCHEYLTPCSLEELDMSGGLCEECSGAFDD